MNFSRGYLLKSDDLSNISLLDVQTGNYVSTEKLAERVIQREQENFSSIKINQQQNWQDFLDELFKLTQDEYDEDFLAPTDFSYQTMRKFLKGLCENFSRPLPIPNFIPDGEGGIRAEWNIRGKEIRLVCPAKFDWKPYIYFEEGDFYDVEKDVKMKSLIKHFIWLLE